MAGWDSTDWLSQNIQYLKQVQSDIASAIAERYIASGRSTAGLTYYIGDGTLKGNPQTSDFQGMQICGVSSSFDIVRNIDRFRSHISLLLSGQGAYCASSGNPEAFVMSDGYGRWVINSLLQYSDGTTAWIKYGGSGVSGFKYNRVSDYRIWRQFFNVLNTLDGKIVSYNWYLHTSNASTFDYGPSWMHSYESTNAAGAGALFATTFWELHALGPPSSSGLCSTGGWDYLDVYQNSVEIGYSMRQNQGVGAKSVYVYSLPAASSACSDVVYASTIATRGVYLRGVVEFDSRFFDGCVDLGPTETSGLIISPLTFTYVEKSFDMQFDTCGVVGGISTGVSCVSNTFGNGTTQERITLNSTGIGTITGWLSTELGYHYLKCGVVLLAMAQIPVNWYLNTRTYRDVSTGISYYV